VPAQAVVDIKNGVYTGTITSGAADIQDLSLQSIEVADLSGLVVKFGITTTTDPFATIYAYFNIPNAPNPLMQGFYKNGTALEAQAVTQAGNIIFLDGTAFGGTNHLLHFDLAGPLQNGFVNSLAGTINATQWGYNAPYGRVIYNFTLDLTGTGQIIGATVPEPSTWLLMILGIGMVGASARRRQSNSHRPHMAGNR
jgi:hypothetical protein